MQTEKGVEDTALNILHITDCHLTREPDGELLGINTRDSLEAVLERIAEDRIAPDYILATGDLAQDASIEAYQYFQQRMRVFECPISWFPGNHDDLSVMQQVIAKGPELNKVVRIGKWQFILLDSLLPGKVHGWLRDEELATLDKALSQQSDLHTMVCLHHHPIDIDSVWLDRIGLHNRDAFLDIVDRYDHVRAILWGHIHQQVDTVRKGVQLMATPSTCIQFLPRSDKFAIEDIAPGYRWLRLFDDGRIETDVRRAEAFEFQVDLQSNGY